MSTVVAFLFFLDTLSFNDCCRKITTLFPDQIVLNFVDPEKFFRYKILIGFLVLNLICIQNFRILDKSIRERPKLTMLSVQILVQHEFHEMSEFLNRCHKCPENSTSIDTKFYYVLTQLALETSVVGLWPFVAVTVLQFKRKFWPTLYCFEIKL